MSITNIVAIAILSGSPQCPPVRDLGSVDEMASVASAVSVPTQLPLEGPNRNFAVDTAITGSGAITNTAPSTTTEAQPTAATSNETVVAPTKPTAAIDIAAPAAIDRNTIIVTARQGPPRGDPVAVVVRQLTEHVQGDVELIGRLKEAGIVPNARVLVQNSPDGDVTIVVGGHENVLLPHEMAHAVKVEKV